MGARFMFAYGGLIVALSFLAACGGGGGGNGGSAASVPPQSATTPTLSYQQNKLFRFTWNDVTDATHYRLFEDRDGSSGYVQIGQDVAQGVQVYEHEVPLHKRVNARYMLQSCNQYGCTDSKPVYVAGNLISAIGYFKAGNTGSSDAFGASVALSADARTLVVGAPREDGSANGVDGVDDDLSIDAGAVYVFVRNSANVWVQDAYIKASNTGSGDEFGKAVAVSDDGTVIAVGAPGEDSSAIEVGGNQANESSPDAGAVYLFGKNSGGSWQQQAYIKASNTNADDRFGKSVALSGDGYTLAVGAHREQSNAMGVNPPGTGQLDNSLNQAGAVYVYDRDRRSDVWAFVAYVKASNTDELDRFGVSVALSSDGNTMAVGAMGEGSAATTVNGDQADNSRPGSGAVYVFTRPAGGQWQQSAYIKPPYSDIYDGFGIAIDMDSGGQTLAIGVSGDDSGAIGINGDATDNGAADAGAAYIFVNTGQTWVSEAYIKASNTDVGDRFGDVLALSADGGTLAVGAWNEDSRAQGLNGIQNNNSSTFSGAVYVYVRDQGTWTQSAYVKASNSVGGHAFGRAVDLSGDGNVLVVGAEGESNGATGVNGNQTGSFSSNSGAAYLY